MARLTYSGINHFYFLSFYWLHTSLNLNSVRIVCDQSKEISKKTEINKVHGHRRVKVEIRYLFYGIRFWEKLRFDFISDGTLDCANYEFRSYQQTSRLEPNVPIRWNIVKAETHFVHG